MPPTAPSSTFPEELTRLAGALKALAHPARLALLSVLAERGTCVCGALVDELPLAQSTVSQHLKVLKEAGLITGEVDGPRSCYCLDARAVEGLRDLFGGYAEALLRGPGYACGDDASGHGSCC
jgi:ArsR family transcriptional regulator